MPRRPLAVVVPALLALACADRAMAADNLAPVITAPVDVASDAGSADEGSYSSAFDLGTIAGNVWDYDTVGDSWESAAGIAVWFDLGVAWEYAHDGATWVPLSQGEIIDLRIATTPVLRFISETDSPFSAPYVLRWRAWDGSDGLAHGDIADDAAVGGSTALSVDQREILATVSSLNDSPEVYPSGSISHPRYGESPVGRGQSYEFHVSTLVQDADPFDADGDELGIILTGIDETDAAWEWWNGSDWVSLSGVSENNALPIGVYGVLRVSLASDAARPATRNLSFRIWDQSWSGTTAGVPFDLQSADSAWSDAAEPPWSYYAVTAELAVTNVAPTWVASDDLALPPLAVDDADPAGTALADLLAGEISHADGDSDGIAIVAASGAGTWQWRADGNSSWQPLPAVSQAEALLLASPSEIRYLPAGDNETATLTVHAWDQSDPGTDLTGLDGTSACSEASRSLTVVVGSPGNQAPVITTDLSGAISVVEGRTVQVQLAGGDDGDPAQLAWSIASEGVDNGAADFLDGTGPTAILSFTADLDASTGAVRVRVSDAGELSSAETTVSFTITPNTVPGIISPTPGSVAVAGQPWEALITAEDPDSGDLAALTGNAGGGKPAWITVSNPSNGRWRLHGTPPSNSVGQPFGFTFTVTDPSNESDSVTFDVTVTSGDAVAVEGPTLPVSTPGSIAYGAIVPGSSTNLTALGNRVSSLGQDRARAFWWLASGGAFRELPQQPADPVTAGIFLASLDAVTVSFDAAPRPAPFAISLPANSWSLIGIPPIQINATTVATTHAWSDFRLETAAGVPVSGVASLNAVLGKNAGTLDDTRPWTWDGSAYGRTGQLSTGTAYWIRNRSGSAYRLVRATNGSESTFGTFGSISLTRDTAAAPALVVRASAEDAPPAPPAGPRGSTAPAAEPSGSCGAGGLAGLILAGLGLLGLRRSRRI